MKYLAQLKSEKLAVEVLPKLPKAPFDSKDSTDTRHFQENSITLIPVGPLPEWQHDLCIAHADFNNWRGQCPVSLDDCLISKVIESGGNLDQLCGLDLGQGIHSRPLLLEKLHQLSAAS